MAKPQLLQSRRSKIFRIFVQALSLAITTAMLSIDISSLQQNRLNTRSNLLEFGVTSTLVHAAATIKLSAEKLLDGLEGVMIEGVGGAMGGAFRNLLQESYNVTDGNLPSKDQIKVKMLADTRNHDRIHKYPELSSNDAANAVFDILADTQIEILNEFKEGLLGPAAVESIGQNVKSSISAYATADDNLLASFDEAKKVPSLALTVGPFSLCAVLIELNTLGDVKYEDRACNMLLTYDQSTEVIYASVSALYGGIMTAVDKINIIDRSTINIDDNTLRAVAGSFIKPAFTAIMTFSIMMFTLQALGLLFSILSLFNLTVLTGNVVNTLSVLVGAIYTFFVIILPISIRTLALGSLFTNASPYLIYHTGIGFSAIYTLITTILLTSLPSLRVSEKRNTFNSRSRVSTITSAF